MTLPKTFLAVVAVLCLLAPAGGARAADEPAGEGLSAPLAAVLEDVLVAYEGARVALAADRLEAVPASADDLRAVLEAAQEAALGPPGARGDLAGPLGAAEAAAGALARAEDLAAARLAFGTLSRNLLLVAAQDDRLTAGRHVFSCPMAEGFGRWIQPTAQMANPYMGPAMLQCGAASDWTLTPEPASAEVKRSGLVLSPDRPRFEPGIPGLTMEDVRDHKFLWREIDELQVWERGDRITVAEYRSKVIEKTVYFLSLEGSAAEELTGAAAAEVAAVRTAFRERPEMAGETSGVEGRFSSELAASTARLASLLGDLPRHQIFAPEVKRWLLKLAFAPRESKEAREAAAVGDRTSGGSD